MQMITLTQNTNSAGNYDLQDLILMAETSERTFGKVALYKALAEFSISTGGYVKFLPEIGYLPALIGNDSHPVFLYQLIELFDEFLDYDKILEEYPALSYSQIGGAIAFLRKVAQLNSRDINVDELEEEHDFDNSVLLEELTNALNDKEIACVFPNA